MSNLMNDIEYMALEATQEEITDYIDTVNEQYELNLTDEYKKALAQEEFLVIFEILCDLAWN